MIGLVKRLLKDTDTDFRFIPFGVVILYITSLILSELLLGSYSVLGNIFRIHPIPYFVDLEILLCGIDAIREGLDPYQALCFEGEAYFNYPYLWGVLSIFPFLSASNHIYIGFGLMLLFFVAIYFFIGKINFKSALIYSAILISPAVMLGVERGNSDLMIFLLLMIIPLIAYKSKIVTSLLILLGSMLKIFPIGVIICLFNFRKNDLKKTIVLAFGVLITFLVYVFIIFDNIVMVSEKTPRPFKEASYGLGGLPSFLKNYFKINDDNSIYIFLGFTLFCIFSFTFLFRYLNNKTNQPTICESRTGIAYLIGSGIFLITCLIGYNWEYRLIFLIFTIPQILSWSAVNRYFKLLLLIPFILLIWCSLIIPIVGLVVPNGFAYLISYILTIFLFFMHLYLLLKYAKQQIKLRIKLNSSYL